ncbi:Rab proteins geranylgeranyltransferase component A, partial [Tulasnella sp. 418]
MDNPPEHWDVAVLGTGLAESIIAAALAKAGKRVLHLDENEYYGGDSASLALHELIEWAKKRQEAQSSDESSIYMKNQEAQYSSVTYSFPSSDDPSTPPPSLLQESRQYSVSLSPTLVPSNGPIIDSLIGSGVSRYGEYRLLDSVAVFSQTVSSQSSLKRVPSSKEDVFKNKEMSLIEKRRLMKFLMFAAGEFESSDLLVGQEEALFIPYLQEKFSLSSEISAAIAFAIGHCSRTDTRVLPTLERIRRYLRSSGRYGNSPFLIGHYGGAGEISQGFCRAAAVQGATYILGRGLESIKREADGSKFVIRMDGFLNPLTAELVVASDSYADPGAASETATSLAPPRIARCIAVLDSPIPLPVQDSASSEAAATGSIPDTLLVVFPPDALPERSTCGPVTALQTGDRTMSCPAGK